MYSKNGKCKEHFSYEETFNFVFTKDVYGIVHVSVPSATMHLRLAQCWSITGRA